MEVIILRGMPGSGKSTWASEYLQELQNVESTGIVVSADSFHMVEGKYQFDPSRIGYAHNQCLQSYLTKLQANQTDVLIVDNTNLTAWEIAPYYRLAEVFSNPVKIVRLECDFRTSVLRNIHDVPEQRLWQMWQTLQSERLPAHWREQIIVSYT